MLPGEGHGVLISGQWILTAAHAAVWRPIQEVLLNGTPRRVRRVVVHPGYKTVLKELEVGDAAGLMKFMESRDDVALIELEVPTNDVQPAAIYRGRDEAGMTAEIVG